MDIIFMGTPYFAVPVLQSLIDSGHNIKAVYTKEPKPAGRGQKEQKTPVHELALSYNIPVNTPKSLKSAEVQQQFKSYNAEIAVVVAYGLLLPSPILSSCKCINIHASILPRWRGAAPIQRSIIAGDKISGVTTMLMDEGMDTGDILMKEEINIEVMTGGQLHDALSEMGSRIIIKTLNNLDSIVPVKQEGNVTYANKIGKEEALIDFNNSAVDIERLIRAFNPFPGAYFKYKDQTIKIYDAEIGSSTDKSPGTIFDKNLSIACREGSIIPKIVQRQGKKTMSTTDMLRGFEFKIGDVVNL